MGEPGELLAKKIAAALDELDPGVGRQFASVLAEVHRQEWADELIDELSAEHPEAANRLYHSFALLTPTDPLMNTSFVYQSHVRELLARVVAGEDTRPGTAAEICCACSHASMVVPLNTAAAGLYVRAWRLAFPDHEWQMPAGEHYEALEGSSIDTLERETRQWFARRLDGRRLKGVVCTGQHHGEPVLGCEFLPKPGKPAKAATPVIEPVDYDGGGEPLTLF